MKVFDRLTRPLLRWAAGIYRRSPKLRGALYCVLPDPLALSQGRETFVVRTGDAHIGWGLYTYHGYEDDKLERAVRLIGPEVAQNLVLVDIGANVGSVCIPAVSRGIVARAVAVEPEPANLRLLRANIALNGLDDRIAVMGCALGESEGRGDLELSPVNFGDHRLRDSGPVAPGAFGEAARSVVEVEVRPLDAIVAEAGLGDSDLFLWIDAQGSEGAVLAGAGRTLAARPPLVLEFWPYALARSGGYDALKAALLGAGYRSLVDLTDTVLPEAELSEEGLDRIWRRLEGGTGAADLLIR